MSAIIGFAGFSNSGKTTLITKLVRHFTANGIRTAVIKHDGHGHYKEAEGKDSSSYIEAGANAAVVVSPDSYIVYRRVPRTLEQIIAELPLDELDLVLVEGFKEGTHDQIVVFRNSDQAEVIQMLARSPVAAAAPNELWEHAEKLGIPSFNPEDVESIAGFIQQRYRLFI